MARRCPAARSCACWPRTTPNWRQALQDAFEDAVLMGVDEQAMRRILTGMVEGLQSPKRADR